MKDRKEKVMLRSWFRPALETLAYPEAYQAMFTLPFMRKLPRGDGHPVVLGPGYGFGNWVMLLLYFFLKNLEYSPYNWGQGINWGYNDEVGAELFKHLNLIADIHQCVPSFIGWSLGGTYPKVIGNIYPDLLRSIITLGSPATIPEGTAILKIYQKFSKFFGVELENIDPMLMELFKEDSKVPLTAIWSKRDGIIPWKYCKVKPAKHTENIEVSSSHIGYLYNPTVYKVIADRLAQKEGIWAPYRKKMIMDSALARVKLTPEMAY